jgi:type IV pilus assembly protein PilC
MDYSYTAYTKERKMVKGRLNAISEQAALSKLGYGGYQVVKLTPVSEFLDWRKTFERFTKVNQSDLVMFSRQFALLIESGIGAVRALELLQTQTSNAIFRGVIGDVIVDLRDGKSLAAAFSKHPTVFPQMYHRAIAAGEQAGNLDEVLRQMADFTERAVNSQKKIKSALMYPIIVSIVAILVIGVLVSFVLPSYTSLFTQFGADLPLSTKILMGVSEWSAKYGVYVMLLFLVAIGGAFAYTKTAEGAYLWDKVSLRLPVMGHVNHLNQLSFSCRIMSLLFRVGLRPPDAVALAIDGCTNRVVADALRGVREELIRGDGFAKPMSRRSVFLPLMVQMVAIGEETGNLSKAFSTVAQSYETEADERSRTAIAMIQPAITIVLGAGVVLIAMVLVSTMYGVFGQLQF